MKTMKRILAGSVALLMMLTVLLTSALAAADSYTSNYTDVDPSYRSYKAYQIFKGQSYQGTLASVTWGTGIRGDAFLNALKVSTAFNPNPFINANNAHDVAAAMVDGPSTTNWVDDGPYAHAFAKLAYQYRIDGAGINVTDGVTVLDKGYYLVVDEHTPNPGQGESFNMVLLQLTDKGNFRIVSKASSPVVEKKVKEREDVSGNEVWQDAADYDVGDNVPFQLTATIGDIRQYEKYYIQFNDTLNDAFTYNGDARVMKITNNGVTTDVTPYFDIVYVGTSPKTLTVSPRNTVNYDVKNSVIGVVKGDKLVVEYTAKFQPVLPTNAGQNGYKNTVNLDYSNNPNISTYPNGTKPTPDQTDKTPDDVVKVFTYAFELNKVDENNVPLPGANFKLEKFDITYNNPMNPGSHWKEIGTITPVYVGTTTKFEWDGLDAGLYRFTEITVPAGYNGYNLGGTDSTSQPMEFTINSSFDMINQPPTLNGLSGVLNDAVAPAVGTALTVTLTENLAKLATNIQNMRGSTLPETGGAGTTMFYVTGSMLLLGGVVLLITKRRMG